MDSRQVVSISIGRRIAGIAAALALGALVPLIAVLQVSLLAPVIMLCGVVAVRLKARGGWLPAMVLFGTAMASTLWFMGATMMFMLLLASVLPPLVVIRGMAQKKPFFEQLNAAIVAYAAGLMAAMAVAYMRFGGSMVARFTDLLRVEFAQMPDAALQPFVDALNSTLAMSGAQGDLYTVTLYRAQLGGVLDLMQQTYAQELPGTLLAGALLSGMLSALWGNWTMARQGLATNESFVGMGEWYLPARVSYGALGLLAAGFILANTGYLAGATVYAAARRLAGTVFAVQAISATDRRMLRAGRALSRRRGLLTVLSVAALLISSIGSVLAIIGAASALFGSHGALKRQDGNNDQSDHGDPQE